MLWRMSLVTMMSRADVTVEYRHAVLCSVAPHNTTFTPCTYRLTVRFQFRWRDGGRDGWKDGWLGEGWMDG